MVLCMCSDVLIGMCLFGGFDLLVVICIMVVYEKVGMGLCDSMVWCYVFVVMFFGVLNDE